MPASRVERAEVMYSAPPQLHVRGAAINIVLKGYKPEESSLQGEINGTYTQLKEAGGEGGITLVYTTPKWETDFMYNVHSRYSRQSMDFLPATRWKIKFTMSPSTMTDKDEIWRI